MFKRLKEPLINSGLGRALLMEKRVLRLRFATLRTNRAIVQSFLELTNFKWVLRGFVWVR